MAKSPKKKRITEKLVQATENKPAPQIPSAIPKPEVDEDPWGDDGLTIRQRLMIEALVGPAGGNATKAAEMAGYAAGNRQSLHVTASQILSYPKVQEALAHAFAKKRMTPEWAEAAAADLATVSMANFLTVGPDGKPEFDWEKAAAVGAIGHIREYKEEGFESSGSPVIIKRSFKLFDKQKAIDTVLKLRGLLKETVKHEGEVKFTQDSTALKKLMADPAALEAATQLADRLKALEANEPNRN